MALTKVTGAGVEGVTISSTTDTSDQFIITNTDTSASSGPDLVLHRKSTSSAADNDVLGRIDFRGLNDANEEINYFTISARIDDNTDGTENGMLRLQHIKNGSYVEPVVIDGSGNVGIGTDTPQEQVHVYGGSTAGLRVSGGGNNNMKCEIGYDNSAGPYIKAGSSGQTDLHIYTDNTALAAEFRANGDFYSNDGTVHSLSDIRIKKDVADLTDGLDIVKQLKPKTFKYTEDSEFYNEKTKDKIKYGFVANEVEAVAPQYTDTGKGSIGGKEVNDFKSLSTTKMIPMLVKAIQELSTALDVAVARIKKLEDG